MIFSVSQAFKLNPSPTCVVTKNTAAPSDMVRSVSADACYAAAAVAAASDASPYYLASVAAVILHLCGRTLGGGGVQDAPPPHDRVRKPRSKDGGCGCASVVTDARAQGGGVRGGIRVSALRAASLISGDAGVSGDVAVDGDESLLSRYGSP